VQGLWLFIHHRKKEDWGDKAVIFRQKDFWMNVPKGTEVLVKKSDNPKPVKLYFDEIREFTDYDWDALYVCLQKDPKDIGNKAIALPLIVDDIEDVISVDGKPMKEYRKELKHLGRKSEKKQSPESKPEPSEPSAVDNSQATPVTSKEKPAPSEEKDIPITKPDLGETVARKRKDYGFTITEKDGKFICPCGSVFGRRDTAIYVHRTRHIKN